MAETIVNTPPTSDSGSAGWAVAVIILLAVIAGGFMWYRYHGAAPAQPTPANINVTIPLPGGAENNNTNGGAGNTNQY